MRFAIVESSDGAYEAWDVYGSVKTNEDVREQLRCRYRGYSFNVVALADIDIGRDHQEILKHLKRLLEIIQDGESLQGAWKTISLLIGAAFKAGVRRGIQIEQG